MKITIITVTFNSRQFITDALESIQSQTHVDLEHIIVDGASTDNTLKLIKRASKRVDSIISEPDQGIYDALNKGIMRATGDVIGLLHSDDMFASLNTLQDIAKVFSTSSSENGSSPDVLYGDLVYVDRNDTNKVVRYWKSEAFKRSLLNKGWMPPHPTLFMRRKVYEKHGLYNASIKCAADYDYILRVFSDKTLTFSYLPEVITKMRVGGVSTGGIKNLINKRKEDYWVLKNNKMPFPLWILFLKNILKVHQLIYLKR